MHGGNDAIAAVFPLGLVAGTAATAPGDVPGWLGRAYDAVVSHIGDRLVASAVKVQAVADTFSAAKVAAVAASAAALAGGGVVVAERVVPDAQPVAVRTAPTPAAHPPGVVTVTPAPATTPVAPAGAAKSPEVPKRKKRKARAETEFRPVVPAPVTAPDPPQAKPQTRGSSSAVREFAP